MPSAALAAEPGTTLMAMKRMIDAANSVGTKTVRRIAISRSMGSSTARGGSRVRPSVVEPCNRALAFEPRVLEGLQEAGAHRLIVLQLVRMGDQQPAIDQGHLPHVIERELRHLLVQLLALGLCGRCLGFLQQLVHLLV